MTYFKEHALVFSPKSPVILNISEDFFALLSGIILSALCITRDFPSNQAVYDNGHFLNTTPK